MRTALHNGTLLTPIRTIPNASLVIQNGVIQSIVSADDVQARDFDRVVDAEGHYVTPGFIDIHVHGGGGFDIMSGSPEAIAGLARLHLSHGTTTMLPTTTTGTREDLLSVVDAFNTLEREKTTRPFFPGLHLEGPYVSAEQAGAQDKETLRAPDPAEYTELIKRSGRILRWSIAPELDGAWEMAKTLRRHGIMCAIAHSDALYEQVLEAYEHGFGLVTHLYSGCSSIRRIDAFRHAGVVEAAYLIDEMFIELIADGSHLPESLLKLAYRIKGADKICLVTDAVMAAGLGPGEYRRRDGRKIIVEDGVAKLMDRSSFAGSVATMDRLIRVMVEIAGVDLQNAVKMATLTPARLLGLTASKGVLAPGRDADLVILDSNLKVASVVVAGDFFDPQALRPANSTAEITSRR